MIAGPGSEGAAGHGHMRASDADRDRVIDVLKAAFAEGRLARDEFDARVGHVLAARTYADLYALTWDIPHGLAAAQSAPRPGPARDKALIGVNVWAGDRAIMAMALFSGLALVAAVVLQTGLPLLGAVGGAFVSLFLLGARTRGARRDKRPSSRRPPLPGLGTGQQAAPGTRPEQLPWTEPRRRTNTDAGPSRRPRPQATGRRRLVSAS
jgi:hypothetical protein